MTMMTMMTMNDMYTNRGAPDAASVLRLMMTGMITEMTGPKACMFIKIVAYEPLSFSFEYAVAMDFS